MSKLIKAILLVTFTLCLGFFIVSCTDPDVPNVSNDFELVGTWNFDRIDGDAGTISSNDPDPEGCVTFNADGTGSSFFKFSMFTVDVDIGEGAITYVTDGKMPPEVVTITQTDGDVFVWTFSEGTDTSAVASFPFDLPDPAPGSVQTTVQLSKK